MLWLALPDLPVCFTHGNLYTLHVCGCVRIHPIVISGKFCNNSPLHNCLKPSQFILASLDYKTVIMSYNFI